MHACTIKMCQEGVYMWAIAAEKKAQVYDLKGNNKNCGHSHHHHEGKFQFVKRTDWKNQIC